MGCEPPMPTILDTRGGHYRQESETRLVAAVAVLADSLKRIRADAREAARHAKALTKEELRSALLRAAAACERALEH